MTYELDTLSLFLEEYAKAKEELSETPADNTIYYLSDETSIHVYEGMKCMGIYDKDTGVPKFEDNDIYLKVTDDELDKAWARDRNREIEGEITELRESLVSLNKERRSLVDSGYQSDILNNNILNSSIREKERRIERLLSERDDITYKYGLAGSEFEKLYLEKKEHRPEEPPKDYSHKPNINEARFKKITKEMLDLYSRKNTDYGGSFDESLDEDGLLVSKIRMGDKYKRFGQLIENDAQIDDETMEDTLIDLANYAIMTLMWIREQEDK